MPTPCSWASASRPATPRRRAREEAGGLLVCVRVRPHGSTESRAAAIADAADGTIAVQSSSTAPRAFAYDRAFGPATSQAEVFEFAGSPLCEAVLDGYNATIFAFGQTGSGKTFTMCARRRDAERCHELALPRARSPACAQARTRAIPAPTPPARAGTARRRATRAD